MLSSKSRFIFKEGSQNEDDEQELSGLEDSGEEEICEFDDDGKQKTKVNIKIRDLAH